MIFFVLSATPPYWQRDVTILDRNIETEASDLAAKGTSSRVISEHFGHHRVEALMTNPGLPTVASGREVCLTYTSLSVPRPDWNNPLWHSWDREAQNYITGQLLLRKHYRTLN